MYTDDKNAQVVLALLKKYNVRKIVVSPGTTNVPIARSVQQDPFFEVYSVVDERGAAYFAGGLAFSSGEPVAISCTGATASRDYLPGLTEAYYRHLPVIAITSQHHSSTYQDLVPQMTDRTVSQNDIKLYSADCPYIKDREDQKTCERIVNIALHTATYGIKGPVHINLPVSPAYAFTTLELPDIKKIEVYNTENFPVDELAQEIADKRVGIFIGSHKPFSEEERKAIDSFVEAYDATVFYDHTSCYKGKNGVMISHGALSLAKEDMPDLLIDMGSICGDYNGGAIFIGKTTWRLSEDGVFHNRFNAVELEAVFDCPEKFFFSNMAKHSTTIKYYSEIKEKINTTAPMLPFSNLYICSQISKMIPDNSILHMGILNSLRSMDYFSIDSGKNVLTSSNVGGFGIDGALSTLLGQSMADDKKLAFGVVGDLAFFYDMNTLGNRHVHNRLRILLINNGRGVEFRLNKKLENQWGSDTDDLIAAEGHFGSAKGWAQSMGFTYMTANDKVSFDAQIKDFCSEDINHFDAPVVFEVFTRVFDEKQALDNMINYLRPIEMK